jgi:hypothetical protein
MCGVSVRDITHITSIVTGISGGLTIIGVVVLCVVTAGSFALDDIFATAALTSALPMGTLELFMAVDGLGTNIWIVLPEKIYRIVQVSCSSSKSWRTLIFRSLRG